MKMKNPLEYYKIGVQTNQLQVKKYQKKIVFLSTLRLLVFVATAVGIYWFFNIWQMALAITVLGGVAFVFLLSKYTDAKRLRALHKALMNINETELNIASGHFQDREQGLQFQDANHFYSLDIDLFGRGSFFQYINRTTSTEGAKRLADELKANNTNGIVSRQEAIKELSFNPEWRQNYAATSSLVRVETPADQITTWFKKHQSFLPKVTGWLPLAFGFGTLVLFGLAVFGVLNNLGIIGYWLLLGLAITGAFLKKINVLAANTDKIRDTFRQYAQLLDLIENVSFSSELLKEKQQQIQLKDEKASLIFKRFSRALDALDNRNNLIGAIFGNGFFLTDLRNAYRIEKWLECYGEKVSDWFEVVAFFDAYNTLGNFAFNHSEFVFPEITNSSTTVEAKSLGHPLLKKEKRIDSDLVIKDGQFFIVTGANMAGKSTFLRTVSLHIVMANIGLPVCAKSSRYSPVKLITSMRTTDSLADESSYFFSELTRLKYIVDALENEPYFIVLDEILKGTNSTDKAMGSRKFVEKLVASKATGIIATHDLSLCEIAEELQAVKNYFFDAKIINDELHFDYVLKKGVCKNMNASFLLQKMKIV